MRRHDSSLGQRETGMNRLLLPYNFIWMEFYNRSTFVSKKIQKLTLCYIYTLYTGNRTTMIQTLNSRNFSVFNFLVCLQCSISVTINDPLVASTNTTFWGSDNIIPQNFTASITYFTSPSQERTVIIEPVPCSLPNSLPSTSSTSITTLHTTISTGTSQASPSASKTSCIYPGQRKACSFRMTGNCKANTLYSCLNN